MLSQGGSFVGSPLGGNYPLQGLNSFFHCATPRGLIRWVTVGGNNPLQGLNSIFHCAIPRGLIRWVTVGGDYPPQGLNSIFHCATPRGFIRDTTVGGNYLLLTRSLKKGTLFPLWVLRKSMQALYVSHRLRRTLIYNIWRYMNFEIYILLVIFENTMNGAFSNV